MAGARPGWQSRVWAWPAGGPLPPRPPCVCGGEELECGLRVFTAMKNENGLGRCVSLPSFVLFLAESCKGRSVRRKPSLYSLTHVEEKAGRYNPRTVSLNVSQERRYIFLKTFFLSDVI